MKFTPKKKFDKFSVRGIIYSLIALAGISYELFLSVETRPFLIVMYGIGLGIGLLCLLFINEEN